MEGPDEVASMRLLTYLTPSSRIIGADLSGSEPATDLRCYSNFGVEGLVIKLSMPVPRRILSPQLFMPLY